MIVFLGSEYTKQFALHFGRTIEPKKDAIRIKASEKVKEIVKKQAAEKMV